MESCLFCLDSVNKREIVNPIGCACVINAHKECLESWFHQKNQMECPICHRVVVPNRLMLDNVHIVYIQQPLPEESIRRIWETNQKTAAFCCCLVIGWTLGLSILELIYGGF